LDFAFEIFGAVRCVMKSQSFPKKKRILSSEEFKSILNAGRKIRSPSFTVFVCPLSSGREGRLGVSVSKRVGEAHVRNRIRRVVREAFRKRVDLRGWDWVFLVRPEAKKNKNPLLFQEIENIFDRVIHKM